MEPITVHPQISVAENYEQLCAQALKKILVISKESIQERNHCNVALSGGSTPQGVYSLMASHPYCDQFDWEKIDFFFGDERWVPRDDFRSNYKMVADTLLTKISIPSSHVHAINTETPDVQTSADLYEKELIKCFSLKPDEFPQFDLILLGLGKDGHTASLFPNHSSLEDKKHLAVGTEVDETSEKRITLTLPVINHARNIIFLVSGVDKTKVLKEVLEGKQKDRVLPAKRVNPKYGNIWWFVDQKATFLLRKESMLKNFLQS